MNDIAHVIQLAVAPVFLLAGIGTFVNAFAARLGRVFDRIRTLERDYGTASPEWRAPLCEELKSLWHRARLLAIGGLFMAAMLALLGALLIFLREVFIAVSQLRVTLPADVPSGDKPV